MTVLPAASVANGGTPLVSIGLPTYNGQRFLDRALVSLRAQDYPSFEIIISDNASTDETAAICERHAAQDSRIRLVRQSENRGPHANFEAVCREARGSYFMWAADDDVWLPNFVSRLVAELEAHPEAGAAMCGTRLVQEDGTAIDEFRFLGPKDLAYKGALRRGIAVFTSRKYNFYIYALYRTAFLRKAVPYFPRALGGDRMFVCQLVLATPFRYVDDILYVRTRRPAHEAEYIAKFESFRIRFEQFTSCCAMILRSEVVPGHLKFALPVLAAGYASFLVRKEVFEMRTKIKSLLRKVFRGRLELAAVGLALLLAVSGYFISIEANAMEKSLADVPLAVWTLVAALGVVAGLGLVKFVRFYRLWLNSTKGIVAGLNDISFRQRNIERFARYVTDLLLAAPERQGERPPTEQWLYGLNNLNTVRKQVQFARELEASRIRELYLHEIFPDIGTVSLPIGAVNELSGHPNKVDMLYVCAIAKLRGAMRIFEFGTYQGRTTYHLALATEETQVTTIDLPPDPNWDYSKYNGIYFRGSPVEKRITQLFLDSRELDTRPMSKSFDFVFVDGDHSYQGVKNDTRKAFELLAPGGMIMWHDYAPKSAELVRFFRTFTQDRPLFRIRRTCLLLHIDGVDPMTFEPHPMLPSLELSHQASEPFRVDQTYHH